MKGSLTLLLLGTAMLPGCSPQVESGEIQEVAVVMAGPYQDQEDASVKHYKLDGCKFWVRTRGRIAVYSESGMMAEDIKKGDRIRACALLKVGMQVTITYQWGFLPSWEGSLLAPQ